MTDLNDFFYVDGTDDVMAAYVNNLLAATMRSEYKNIETLSATRTLTDADTPIQRFDCGGASRIVKAAEGDLIENHLFWVVNASDGSEVITLKSFDEVTTLATVNEGEGALIIPDGAGGYLALGVVDLSPYLLRSGLSEWDEQASNPSTPASGKWKLFFKSGGAYIIDDAGVVTGPLGSGGGGGDMLSTLVSAEVSITTTATLTISKMHVCSGTTADYTVTLPAASGNAGKFVGVRGATALTKKITIDGNASELVNGVASMDIQAGYSVILMCDGANWFTISQRSKIGAWITLNGTGTIAILASQNVSSITDNSTGRYTINFITAFPDANYCAQIGGANSASNKSIASNTTTSCQINFYETGVGYVDVNPATALFVR